MKRKSWLLLTLFLAMALAVTACSTEEAPEEAAPAAEEQVAEEATPAAEEQVAEEATPAAEEGDSGAGGAMEGSDSYYERALAGEFDGTAVTVFSPAVDEDERKFNETMAAFEEATGIDIQYEGSKEFEAAISVRADAGNPPDIADFPQPGLLASFVRDGLIVDLNQHFADGYLQGQYIDSWLDMATMEGPNGDIMAGVWFRVFGKSQVFYPKAPWDAAGYEIPETWDDLLALSDQIVADGDAPWCIGIESGVATGWTATDWTEEMMLRTTSLDNYDAWVAGTLDFDSPEVKNAIETWSNIWFNDDYVLGGRSSIATTSFGDAPTPMFDDPPQCWLHKQGSFITSFFPEGTTADDYGIFYLPPIDPAYGKPYLVSGDLFAAFSDRPEVLATMEYMAKGESLSVWMEQGGALSPHKDADLSSYGNPVDAQIGAFIAEATSVRFDASDLMPGEVGAGTFWTEMTSYVSGSSDLDTALANIDASWPEGVVGEDAAEMDGGSGDAVGGSWVARAMEGEFAGEVVTVFSPAVDEDERKFNETVAAFEEATGIDIQYEGSKEFEAAISVRADAGNPPDIADFPQPGLLASFVRDGLIVDLNEHFDDGYLQNQYIDSWLDMATMEGPDGDMMAGVWFRVFGKSQVFYPKAPWEAAGYEVPETWDELLALSDTIASDGDAPWCIGIESGVATGWTATDWTEEMMLRTTSLDNYDAWVAGTLDFDSPEVKNAIETWSNIWFNDDYVLGGRSSIATTSFGDAPTPMFDDPPQCWLHKQGSFITSFFPEGTTADDYGIFYLPPVDDAYGKPYLVSGDLFAAFSDRPAVLATMEYLATGDSLAEWMRQGGALSPHKDADLSNYGNPVDAQIGSFIAEATSVRFDASDLMPGEVGAGTFWTEMTSYVSGSSDLDTALANIDASWPEGTAGQDASEIEGGSADSPGFVERALAGEFDGTVVTVFSPAVDEDERKFNETVAAFEEATGIDIQYEGSKEFEAAISVRADAGNPPDIADFPQPGLLASFAADGLIVDLNQHFPDGYLEGQYIDSWLDMASMPGPDGDIMAGVWFRVFGKSQVFYPKAAWDAAGYEVPETWDELLALSQTISDDGDAPWCIGIESGVATGWTATDWMEEVMLRTTSLENYDAWTTGDLPFASPEVTNAAETLAEIWFNDDYVLGGRSSIATTSFGDAPTPMFDDPPQCWLHKQGSFITSFFPEGTTADDYGIFYLPPIDPAYGKPYLVSGDLFAAFSDRPEVIAVMEYLSTGESLRVWMEQGGALSPHKDADLSWYGNPVDSQIGAFIADATSVRFDGSDLMPGEVGAGTFWTEMTDWVSGTSDLETALENIDASWPN